MASTCRQRAAAAVSHLRAASCRPADVTATLLVVPHRPSQIGSSSLSVAHHHHRIPVSPVAEPHLFLQSPPSQSLLWPSSSLPPAPVFATASGNPVTCGDGAATQIQATAIDLDFPLSWREHKLL
uniref:Uncharacterized protein n=1 Tax=Oryza punctata TaxID=4537 RepID=A0A0E0LLN4_ORYPU